MAQSVIVKNKEIRVKNPQMVVEDENRAELIEFTITNAYSIEDVEGMIFYVQYRNKLGEVGMDTLVNAYPSEIVHNDMLVLDWLPSASFTKERGKIEIQIVGFTESLVVTSDPTYQSGKLYFSDSTGTFIPVYPATSTHSPKVGDPITGTVYENQVTGSDHRWSTEKCILLLPENIYDNGTPIYTEAQVKSLITQIQEELSYAGTNALKAEGFAIGEQNGTEVGSDSPYYHNNAKYYNEQAEEAESSASDSATEANAYKIDAENARDKAEEWATKTNGKIDNIDYSAKHYAGEARDYAQDADNARIDSVTEAISPYDGGTNTIIITYKDGTTKTFTVTNGHTGEAFYVFKTYSSIYAMEADLANVPKGKFVLIASNVIDPDNAKLYYRNDSAFQFITDLSGATGAGIPAGGTTGQVVRKKSNTDYELEWSDEQDISGKFDKTDISQTIGPEIDNVPSNAAVNSAINAINTRVTNIEETLMGENEITVQYPDDGNYSSLMPNKVPLRALKFAEVPTFRGKTRAWNQLAKDLNSTNWIFDSATGSFSDGVATFTASAYRGNVVMSTGEKTLPNVAGKNVLMSVLVKTTTATSDIKLYAYGGYCVKSGTATTGWQRITAIATTSASWGHDLTDNNRAKVEDYRTGSWDAIQVKDWVVRDLCLIAPEFTPSGNVDNDLAYLVQQIPDILKADAYDAGSLVDTTVEGVKTTSRNILDGSKLRQGDYNALSSIRVSMDVANRPWINAGTYTIRQKTANVLRLWLMTSDENNNLIETPVVGVYDKSAAATFTKGGYLTVIFGFANDGIITPEDVMAQEVMVVRGSTDPSKFSAYADPLDTLLLSTLVPLKSAGSVAEVLTLQTGKKTRPIGSVDLGTLSWGESGGIYYATLADMASDAEGVCSNYVVTHKNAPDLADGEMNCGYNAGYLQIKTSSSPTGTLNYELATPLSDEQVCDPVPYNFPEVEGGGTVETIQTQTPVIDNCLDVTYDIIPV